MTLASLVADANARVDALGPWLFDLISGTNPFWKQEWLQKENWEKFLKGMRIALTMVGAALLMYEARAYKLREHIPARWKRNVAILFTVLGFGVYFDYFNPNTRYAEYYHRHEFFHYYLGSKYFSEVGYKQLYECSAIAEVELGRGANVRKRDIRDLRVNLIKPMVDTAVFKNPKECTDRFTPERWAAFKEDVDWFYKSAAGSYWENMHKDHGYNPPPVWTMTGKFFANFGSASDSFFKYLASIDVLLHIGAVAMLVWAFGWKVTAIATVFWGCNKAADFYWTGGAFLRQDWWFFLVAALCLTRKRMFFLAGFALMWSALLRVFPAIFFAGWAIVIAIYMLQRLRGQRESADGKGGLLGLLHPDHRRLIAGSVTSLVLLVGFSTWSTSTPAKPGEARNWFGPYVAFYNHTLTTHQNTALTNHMGLQPILVHNWEGRMRFLRNDNWDDPFEGWKKNRSDRFKALKPVFYAILLGILGWTVWALRRTKLLWVALPLSLALVVTLSNLTCYYYSMYIVAAAIVALRPQIGPPLLVTAGVSSFMLWAPIGYYWVDDRFVAQSYLFFALALMLLWVYSRPFTLERLKAWWQLRAEPKLPKAPRSAGTLPSASSPAE
jgi:hypothetical protein